MKQELIQLMRAQIAALPAAAVYVFGSTAAGRERFDSDMDIAVLPSAPISARDMMKISSGLSEVLGRDVDLIDLSRASAVLRKEVVVTGLVVYETDRRQRREFEMYALSDYARLNEERAPILAALGQPLAGNG